MGEIAQRLPKQAGGLVLLLLLGMLRTPVNESPHPSQLCSATWWTHQWKLFRKTFPQLGANTKPQKGLLHFFKIIIIFRWLL